MSSFLHKNVLITGGASGIGRLMAEKALSAGAANLVIWDKDDERLAQLAERLTDDGASVHAYLVDLTDLDQILAAGEMVLNEIGTVDILFNNAGLVTGRLFTDNTPEQIERVIRVNVLAVMQTTRVFLPAMLEQRSGHIVNIASAASLMANPRMAVYAGSKWAVTGWSESLRIELEQSGSGVHVTTLQPGYIDTGMFEGVTAPLLTPILDPDSITDTIIGAVQRNKAVVREPFMVKLIPFLKGVMPARLFHWVAGRLFGVYRSMDSFTGRSQAADS